ncbi:unnamed protein product, partial [Iphiclides podalirius]
MAEADRVTGEFARTRRTDDASDTPYWLETDCRRHGHLNEPSYQATRDRCNSSKFETEFPLSVRVASLDDATVIVTGPRGVFSPPRRGVAGNGKTSIFGARSVTPWDEPDRLRRPRDSQQIWTI